MNLTWYPAESADAEHDDRETDLRHARNPGGASWAVVTQDGKGALPWLWFVYRHWRWEDIDADPDALLANGEAASQEAAMTAVESWAAGETT